MQPYPHQYRVGAAAGSTGTVRVRSEGLPGLETNSPPEFDGPPGFWSPETLLLGALADCYTLTFRAVARASKLEWQSIEVDVQGVLDRADGVARFTRVTITPRLALPEGTRHSAAQLALEKSKRVCIIANSLQAECVLEPAVLTGGEATTA
jgi:organic hydroperoxide reductase OsmC/OhrA